MTGSTSLAFVLSIRTSLQMFDKLCMTNRYLIDKIKRMIHNHIPQLSTRTICNLSRNPRISLFHTLYYFLSSPLKSRITTVNYCLLSQHNKGEKKRGNYITEKHLVLLHWRIQLEVYIQKTPLTVYLENILYCLKS